MPHPGANTVRRVLRIDRRVAEELDSILPRDPATGSPLYGTRSLVVSSIIGQWLAERRKIADSGTPMSHVPAAPKLEDF